MSRKIIPSFPRVLALMRQDARYRDSDEKLVGEIWHIDMKRLKGEDYMKRFSAMDFIILYSLGEITPADSITRSRRKVEEKYPDLRGKTYLHRHNIETTHTIKELSAL